MAKQTPFVQPPRQPGLLSRLAGLRGGLGEYGSEVAGLLVLALALLTLLGLVGLTGGAWLSPWVGLWRRWLGWGSVLVVLGLVWAGWSLLTRRKTSFSTGAADRLRIHHLRLLGLIEPGHRPLA